MSLSVPVVDCSGLPPQLPKATYSPSIEWVLENADVPLAYAPGPPDPKTEVVALATSVFAGVAARPFDSHRLLVAQIAVDHGVNFWILPSQERMPFPHAPLYAVASMIRTEKSVGRKADWFLWLEDDVSVPFTLLRDLRAVAHPETSPFVAAIGHDRYPKFWPTVWEGDWGDLKQWHVVPDDGVRKVDACGLVAALFHRSLFDRVPQPWFGVGNSVVVAHEEKGVDVKHGIQPDFTWAKQMRKAGIPIYVHTGIMVTHFGIPLPVNTITAAVFREQAFLERMRMEKMTRGRV